MFRVPPLVVTATSSVPAAAARRADSMMAPVTVSALFGLITMIFTAPLPPSAHSVHSRRRPIMTVLVLQHVPYEGHGYIADYLQEHSIEFGVVRLWESYTLPDISRYSALIIMGGPMAVYEEFPSRNDELAL